MNNSRGFDDLDVLIYAAMKYVGNRELEEYNSADTGIVFSERAQKRLIKHLMRERDYIEKHRTYRPGHELFKRIAIAILVAITVLFTACMCIEPIRNAIFDFFIEEYEDYYAVEVAEATPQAVAEPQTPPTEILEYREPQLPDDFERFELAKNKYNFYVEYENADTLIMYTQQLIGANKSFISELNTELININIGKYDGLMEGYSPDDTKSSISLYWKDYEYSYILTGNVDYQTMLNMAESIK